MSRLLSVASLLFASFAFSCKTFQVSETKTIANTPSMGVEWDYSGVLTPELKPKVDSVINQAIVDFNKQSSHLKLHLKGKKEKDYISLDITKAKKVGGGGKAAGYIVSTIGLIIVPAAMIAGDAGAFILFAYLPDHQVTSRGELSPNISADKKSGGPVAGSASALFGKDSKRIPKMLTRYHDQLMKTFFKIEAQLVSNSEITAITKNLH